MIFERILFLHFGGSLRALHLFDWETSTTLLSSERMSFKSGFISSRRVGMMIWTGMTWDWGSHDSKREQGLPFFVLSDSLLLPFLEESD